MRKEKPLFYYIPKTEFLPLAELMGSLRRRLRFESQDKSRVGQVHGPWSLLSEQSGETWRGNMCQGCTQMFQLWQAVW